MFNNLNLQIISCLLFLIALGSCNNSKTNAPEDYIRIGDGGGFAGKETLYTIYKNGTLEQTGKKLGKIRKSEVNQLFNNFSILKLDKEEWNKPGNLYKFIEFHGNGKMHRLTWDSHGKDINDNLNLYYNHVNHIIQKTIK